MAWSDKAREEALKTRQWQAEQRRLKEAKDAEIARKVAEAEAERKRREAEKAEKEAEAARKRAEKAAEAAAKKRN